jgi:hypothetical protein
LCLSPSAANKGRKKGHQNKCSSTAKQHTSTQFKQGNIL